MFSEIKSRKPSRLSALLLLKSEQVFGRLLPVFIFLRPKPGAIIIKFLPWNKMRTGFTMNNFTIQNPIDRLRETDDLFTGVISKGPGFFYLLSRADAK
jgi:hypothetical protein